MTTSVGYLSVGASFVVVVAATLLLTPLGERPLTALFAVGDAATIDFATLTPPADPNWFLVCPPGLCAATATAGPVFEISAERLRARWREVVAAQPRTELLAEHPDGWQFDYVQRSARFRFPDIVTVRFIAVAPERSTLAVYSRSVFGASDFGVNRARTEAWLAILSERR